MKQANRYHIPLLLLIGIVVCSLAACSASRRMGCPMKITKVQVPASKSLSA